MRCGQSGHQARNCPSQGDRKRKIEEQEELVGMVENTATAERYNIDQVPDAAVQDGGAASFLGSYVQIRRYLFYLKDLGYNIENIEVFKCKKGFKYGNSEKEIATLCLLLPIFAGFRRRHVLCYAVGGTCAILIGRPLLERLGLTVDYATRKYKRKGQPWQPVTLGPKDEYLVRLAENYEEEQPEVLVPDDHEEHIDFTNKLTVDYLMNDEPCGESDTIGMAAEDETNDRDVTECALTPSPMPSPDCDNEVAPSGHNTGDTPINVEDNEHSGDMQAEEPNRNEEGSPTEFVYTLHDMILQRSRD